MPAKTNPILSENEQKVIAALRLSPELEDCFLEMIDIVRAPLGMLDCGDDAEDAVVSAIQKTGRVLLEGWAEKKSDEMRQETAMESGKHLHGKKKLHGKPL